jgi:tetratricopeptide (TPR) repeat protein
MSLFGLAEYYRLYKKDLYKASEYLTISLDQCERILQSNPSNAIILGIAAQSAGLLGQINYKTGQFLEAIRNTEYSIELVPGIRRTYIQLASFYFGTDQPQQAREVLDQALKNVSNPNDRGFIGLVQGRYSMVEGKYQAAEKYWASAMNDLGDPRLPYYDYALLYRVVMLKKLGNHRAADSLIQERLENRGINSWPEPIMYHFSGNLNEEDLINLAKRDWQKCEAFFFLGEKYLLLGNLAEAKRYFETAVGTKATNYLEYDMSVAELGRAFQQTE